MERVLTTAIGRWRALKLIQYTARFVLLLATPRTVPVTRELYVISQVLSLSAAQKALLTQLALQCSLQKRVLSLGNAYKPAKAIIVAGIDQLLALRESRIAGPSSPRGGGHNRARSRLSTTLERLTKVMPRDHTFPDLLAAQRADSDDEKTSNHSPKSSKRGAINQDPDLVHSEHLLAKPTRLQRARWLLEKTLSVGEDLSEDLYTLAQLGYLPEWLKGFGVYADRCWLASLVLELDDWLGEKRVMARRRRMNALLSHREATRRDQALVQAEFWHDIDGLKICCDMVQAACDVFELGAQATDKLASRATPAEYGIRDFVTICALTSSVLGMYKFVAKPVG
ncbi:hypothetical protein PYCC9005_005221 [Savitreella phatthalungensis]